MKCSLSFFLFLFFGITVSAQPLLQNHAPVLPDGNTYAIVIGISAYQDPNIPQLLFSNRDAVVFADFLMSAPGGLAPKQNIKLLTDSMATIGEVDKAIRWVMNNCRENDKVYFYFSGHGEMENVTMSKNGYLICYNTPSVAFVNMGLSIDYLNDVVNTISVQSKAKVIVITDACHSGTQAGNKFKGNFFVGEQLMLKKQNEIRMASSKPDQLSNEKVDWGGGRGVFSYYLINGLQGGLADADHDKMVSVGELKSYLENKMANDPVLKNEGDVQTPVINGSNDFKLSTVVESETKKIAAQANRDSVIIQLVMGAIPPLPEEINAEPADYFFSLLKKKRLEALTDSAKLNTLPKDEIAFAIISVLSTDSLSAKQKNKLLELTNALKNNSEKLNRFNIDIASAFLDIGQNVIANYIRGDEAELERRRYYNSNNQNYDVYASMFAVALKLSQGDKYYSTKAAVLFHYFSGLALRLKIPLVKNPALLIEQAFAEQNKALQLEEHAAYIFNELGILYQYKNNYARAEKYFTKATQFSPQWAIPQSNLSGLFIARKEYEKALAFADKADSLQNSLQSISINRGFIHERKSNYLFAEECYYNAIDINSRHFAAFERLGYVNMNTGNYAMADSFFYEADLRKKGYHFRGNEWEIGKHMQILSPISLVVCTIDSAILEPTDIFAFFTWGVQEYRNRNYANAARILRKIVAIDKTNPLLYHYLGKIYYDQQKWEEAEVMFKLTILYSKSTKQFDLYVDSVISSKKYKYFHDCYEDFFRSSFYRQVDDYYFLGTLYQNWKHIQEAEKYFSMITEFDTEVKYDHAGVEIVDQNKIDIISYEKTTAYIKLWQLLETQGRYAETEEAVTKYRIISLKHADEELNAFYRRMIDKFPENGDWAYRLGNLLYKYAHFDARLPYFDSIVRFPLLNRELFIDFEIYKNLSSTDSLFLNDQSTSDLLEAVVEVNAATLYTKRKPYVVPGTGEWIVPADDIYMPRKDGIKYLQRAAELLTEKEALADINYKTGNIFLWAGSKKQAYPYFEKSLSFNPNNANARLTLIDIYKPLFKNKAALQQLNYLNDSNQINFEKRLLLAEFDIRAGEFEKAKTLLDKAESIHPYLVTKINNLRGLSNMLAGNYKAGIEFYQKNRLEQQGNNCFTIYAMARLYAKAGNTKEAWNYLQSAIDFGFNYLYVLQNDSYMEGLRNSSKWQNMITNISAKKYKSNFSAN